MSQVGFTLLSWNRWNACPNMLQLQQSGPLVNCRAASFGMVAFRSLFLANTLEWFVLFPTRKLGSLRYYKFPCSLPHTHTHTLFCQIPCSTDSLFHYVHGRAPFSTTLKPWLKPERWLVFTLGNRVRNRWVSERWR